SGHFAELANFAFPLPHRREESLAPRDRLRLRVHFHEGVSLQEPVSVRERTVAHRELPRVDSNARACPTRLESLDTKEHAGLRHLLYQASDRLHLLRTRRLVLFRFCRLVQQHEPHEITPSWNTCVLEPRAILSCDTRARRERIGCFAAGRGAQPVHSRRRDITTTRISYGQASRAWCCSKASVFSRIANEERIVSALRTSLPLDGLYFLQSIDLKGSPTSQETAAWEARFRAGPTGLDRLPRSRA